MELVSNYLEMHQREEEWLVTGNEAWVDCSITETKHQAKVLKKKTHSAGSYMVIVKGFICALPVTQNHNELSLK